MRSFQLPQQIPKFTDFVATPEALTPDWMTAVLLANNVAAAVSSIEVERIGTGQIGQNVRIRMTYRNDASPGPSTLVAKFMSPDPVSRATGIALGNYEREVAFYRDFAPVLRDTAPDMRVAQCWAAEFDAARAATVLVLEDLAPAQQGDQIAGCSVRFAQTAIRQAATFHATFWDAEVLRAKDWLKDPLDPERAGQLKVLLGMFWPGFVDRYRERLTLDAIALGDHVCATADRWILSRTGPFTLTHGDYRLDNLLFYSSDDATEEVRVVAVDWQTPAIGLGGIDIGYFIGAGLVTELRRAHERDLVSLWHSELCERGVQNYSLAQAWDDYRHGQFSGIITAVVASMITERTERGDEMFWAMAGRHLQTALDTDAESLLPHP